MDERTNEETVAGEVNDKNSRRQMMMLSAHPTKLRFEVFQQKRTHVGVLLLVLMVIPLYSSTAFGVCPKPDPKVCAEFFKSDVVLVGRVISERIAPPQGSYFIDGWWYRLSVGKVFRGGTPETMNVFTENSSGRFPLEVGRQYLLFARKDHDRLVIDNCGNSGLVSEVRDKILEIEEVEKRSSGTIEGHIALRPPWTGVGGIRVFVHGGQGVYPSITGEDGWFQMTVPPGKYSIQIESPKVEAFDLSYDNPKGFVVPRGGCAQLQFVVDSRE